MSNTKQINSPIGEVERDLARIRESWREYKKASPKPDAFTFLARIATTGKLRAKCDSRSQKRVEGPLQVTR